MDNLLINNLEFAEKRQQLTGKIALKKLPRLAEMLSNLALADERFSVQYTLTGLHAYNMPSLHLQLRALMPLQCQRCLESLEFTIDLTYDYVLSNEEPVEIESYEDLDWLEISHAMDVGELIEDELLIALPIAPLHTFDCQTQKMESGEKPNPFAVLKGKF